MTVWNGRRWRNDAGATTVRRIGRRLAALTVGLLCALVVALGLVVYLITQQALLQSMDATLRTRAQAPPPPFITQRLASGSQQPPRFPRPAVADPHTDDVHWAIADRSLTVVLGGGPRSGQLADRAAAQRALRTRRASFSTTRIGGAPYLVYTAPLLAGGTLNGVVQTSLSERQYRSSLQALLYGLLIVGGLGALASAAISVVVVRRALRPIRAAIQHQREFVADAAHELRTPLTIMRTATEVGLAANTIADLQDALAQTLAQNSHLTRLVDDLSLLARADSGAGLLAPELVDLVGIVREALAGVEMLAEDRDVQVRLDAPAHAWLHGDPMRLRQLLLILLDNALKFTPSGGTIAVRVEHAGGHARLQVQDSGPGIEPRDLPYLFDRFYRADHARATEGTGLGLAIGRWIAQAHGGQIAAANAPGGGALFIITLPAAR